MSTATVGSDYLLWRLKRIRDGVGFRLPFNGMLSQDELRLIHQHGADGPLKLVYSTVADVPLDLGGSDA